MPWNVVKNMYITAEQCEQFFDWVNQVGNYEIILETFLIQHKRSPNARRNLQIILSSFGVNSPKSSLKELEKEFIVSKTRLTQIIICFLMDFHGLRTQFDPRTAERIPIYGMLYKFNLGYKEQPTPQESP